ncbi:TniQ family protein [Rhizobium ruizarguesonis]
MVLPVTLAHHDDEAAIDFIARLAKANGFASLRGFLAHTDTTANAIVHGEAEALAFVSSWSGVPAARLERLATAASGAGGTWRMGCATLSKDMRSGRVQRFCARCVLKDREMAAGRMASRAYRRAWWSIRGIEGCPVHNCALTEVAVDAEGDVHDFPGFVEDNFKLIDQAAAASFSSSQPELDRYLRDRVFRNDGDGFLDRLDAHVAAEFSRYLGEFLVLHDLKAWMRDDTDSREWGFTLAIRGEQQIRRVVEEVIDHKRPKAKYVESVLGPMVHWLRRNITKDAYQSVVDLMQDILEHNMPFGEGQIILKPVQARHLYCVNSAHADYGITKDRIRALMQANDPGFRGSLPDSRTYFDAPTLRPVLQAAVDTLNSREAGEVLGVSEEMVHGLLRAGVLEQVEQRAKGTRAFVRIQKSELTRFIQTLEAKPTMVSDAEGMPSLSSVVTSLRLPFLQLVGMVLEGSLEALIVPGNGPIFERIHLPSAELTTRGSSTRKSWRKTSVDPLAGGDDKLMRLKEAELALGTTTATVAELVKRGYIRQQVLRRETGRDVKFVERQSLAQFKAVYASLTEIAKFSKGYRAAIKVDLENAGIAPIFEPEGFIARFYRRSELAQAGLSV